MQELASKAYAMLTKQIVPFWLGLKDEENGGFYGYLSYDLELDKRYDKGCILNSRILWFFSEAALLLKSDNSKLYLACRDAADHAYEFLVSHCLDRGFGGVYWSVDYLGNPSDTTKHTYNQAFAIYALSAYYKLSGNAEALCHAFDLYEVVERRCTDDIGYLESFSVDWKPSENDKLSENGIIAQKTMNTLLHVFEGYSALYQVSGDSRVESSLRWILDIYENRIFDPKQRRLLVFFDENYNSILDLYSYGHDIESSWLVDWGCSLLGDMDLVERIASINSILAQNVYREGYVNHSLRAERDRGVEDETRNWWVQAETVLGFAHEALKNPGDDTYLEAAKDVFAFIETKMVDPREGSEWLSALDGDMNPIHKPIVEPWKCPYHNGRMCMNLITLAKEFE